ncbi:urease accessory protein UreF [Synechocystis sp. PCC 7509]|uniref:urease accessory protein UreF n=1 Tax=Synechocystis sp. PCC 7509 TaxID=927677 RepID=UPI0002AC757F|nr:urease accessory protein UreF [Synechocystis sp. PCC 7509]
MSIGDRSQVLSLLQLVSPALPVGAYSYSEGLETLVESKTIINNHTLQHWLEQELSYGAIRLEAAIMVRAYQTTLENDIAALSYWNTWLSAARETSELRASSWQMGQSLMRLLFAIKPQQAQSFCIEGECNYAIALGIFASLEQINLQSLILGYLHSWATNLITAGVKLIPLGQTAGQILLHELHANISDAATEIMSLEDDELSSCSWGLSLASMAHETQYTRLFRS